MTPAAAAHARSTSTPGAGPDRGVALRRLCETAGLGLVRQTSSIIAATGGAVAIGDLRVADHLASGLTPAWRPKARMTS